MKKGANRADIGGAAVRRGCSVDNYPSQGRPMPMRGTRWIWVGERVPPGATGYIRGPQCNGVVEYYSPQRSAIERTVRRNYRPPKHRYDGLYERAARIGIEIMHDPIGIYHVHALLGKDLCDGTLAGTNIARNA